MITLYTVDRDKDDGTRPLLSFVYFHGEAERLADYDLVTMDKGVTIGDGITPVNIRHEWEMRLGLAFIWTADDRRRGLVCLTTDAKSIDFAIRKYVKKERFL